VREVQINIWDRVKNLANGAVTIVEWLGEGGIVVDYQTAQSRAITCLKCPQNQKGDIVTSTVAMAIKRHLEVKNLLNLKVQGEKKLGQCKVCRCVIRLLIWEEQSRVKEQLKYEDQSQYPAECWKIK
jgi:hypothetical protein